MKSHVALRILSLDIIELIVLHQVFIKYGVTKNQIKQKTRELSHVMARHCWRFNLWKYSALSLREIGIRTQKRGSDHSTVIHSRKTWGDIVETGQDEGLQNNIDYNLLVGAQSIDTNGSTIKGIMWGEKLYHDFDSLAEALRETGTADIKLIYK